MRDNMMNRRVLIYDGDEILEDSEREVDWQEIRNARDIELAATDWRAVKDRTMSQAWKDYRQALRDLPQVHDESNNAADHWPEAPEDA